MNLDILSIFIAKVLTILGQGVSANLGCKNFRTEEVGVKLGSWDVRISQKTFKMHQESGQIPIFLIGYTMHYNFVPLQNATTTL